MSQAPSDDDAPFRADLPAGQIIIATCNRHHASTAYYLQLQDVHTEIAQCIAVCLAEKLAEELAIPSLFQRQSRKHRGVSSRSELLVAMPSVANLDVCSQRGEALVSPARLSATIPTMSLIVRWSISWRLGAVCIVCASYRDHSACLRKRVIWCRKSCPHFRLIEFQHNDGSSVYFCLL
jgi:hypothetical protein